MIEKLNFGNSTIIDAVCAHKINELVDAINFITEEFPEQTHALSMAIKNNTEKIEKIDPAKTTYNVATGEMGMSEDQSVGALIKSMGITFEEFLTKAFDIVSKK